MKLEIANANVTLFLFCCPAATGYAALGFIGVVWTGGIPSRACEERSRNLCSSSSYLEIVNDPTQISWEHFSYALAARNKEV